MLHTPLIATRYLLTILPIIGSILLENYPTYDRFTFFALVLLALVEWQRRTLPSRFLPFGLLAELLLAAWMSVHYQGIMFIVLYSTMLACLHESVRKQKIVYLLLIGIALQFALYGKPVMWYAAADVIYVAIVLLLLHLAEMAYSKEQTEQWYDSLRSKHYELDEARKRLIEYARQVEDIAQAEERNRISMEIHDDLGHKLIRLKMMMEAALHILPHQQDKGMDMIHSVRDQLAESMELLRSTVRKLKPHEHSLQSYSLSSLIEDLGAQSGVQVHYETNGLPYSLYPSLELILFRNAQEAITNAIRHGKATEVLIQISFEKKQVVMRVSNNGAIPKEINAKGLGLLGMEERTKLVGGKLLVQMKAPFTVTTLLPNHRKEELA